MILLLAMVFGAVLGWRRAALRGGDRLDKLQYAAVHAIFFALLGYVLAILAQRLAGL